MSSASTIPIENFQRKKQHKQKVQHPRKDIYHYPRVVALKRTIDGLFPELKNKGHTLSDYLRLKVKTSAEMEQFTLFRKDVVRRIMGTQEPLVELTYTTGSMAYSTGIFTHERIFGWSLVVDYSYWSFVFDEVQLQHATIRYYPVFIPSSAGVRGLAVGVIDYDDIGSLSDFDHGLSYDTAKVFYSSTYSGGVDGHVEWKARPQGQPDKIWITTQNTTTTFFTWKAFGQAGPASSSDVAGYLTGKCCVRFRQVDSQ